MTFDKFHCIVDPRESLVACWADCWPTIARTTILAANTVDKNFSATTVTLDGAQRLEISTLIGMLFISHRTASQDSDLGESIDRFETS